MLATALTRAGRLARLPSAPGGLTRLIPLVLFAFGFWQVPLAFTGTDLAYLPGDLIDSRFNNYILEHGYRWMTHRPRGSFWDAPFCYPAKNMTAGSDAHIGTLPVYAAFRLAGAGPERAYQCWILTLFGLNFATSYLSARSLGLTPLGAGVAAYLFSFAPPVVGLTNHSQLLPRFLVLPAFACGWHYLWQPSWRRLAGMAGCVVGQLYCCMYLGLLAGALLGIFVAAAAVIGRRRIPWREHVFAGWRAQVVRAAVVAAAAVAIWPLLTEYVRAAREFESLERDVTRFTPDFRAWLRPAEEAAAWSWLQSLVRTGELYESEKQLFPGAVALAGLTAGLAAVGRAIRGGSPGARLAAAAAVAVLAVPLAFVEIDGRSAYRAALELPGVAKLRAIGRVVLVQLAPLGLLAGLSADALLRRTGPRAAPLVAGAVLVVVFADTATNTPATGGPEPRRFLLADAEVRRRAWAAAIREAPGATFVYAYQDPYASFFEQGVREIDVMWGALDAGVPTGNGYSGYFPRGWFPFADHCGLLHYVRQGRPLTAEFLAGVRVFGRPPHDDARPLERELRDRCPLRQLPPLPPR